MRRTLLMLAGLMLLTAAVYWPVYRYPFVNYDDPDYIFANRYMQAGFTRNTLHYAFTTYTMGNWNPLLWISFLIDHAIFSLKPGPMHVENALLHLISGILLWRLLFVATGSANRSWIVAALFLVDPMHVESVAWITERKDVLSTPILLAAMLLYLRYVRQPAGSKKWIAYGLMLLLCITSLMVKTMGVTLPAVLLLMDYWPLRRWPLRSWVGLVIEKIPLMAIALAAAILGGIAQRFTGATVAMDKIGLLDRFDNAVVCYAIYIVKLLVPTNLIVFYPHPGSRPLSAAFAAAVLLGMITFFFYRIRQRRAFAIVGWLWFLGTLVPVIGLVQLGGQAMADRYSYFPSIGLFIVIVWGTNDLLTKFQKPQTPALRYAQEPGSTRRMRPVPILLSLAVLGLFTALAHIQVLYWQDSETLFTHALSIDDSPVAHVELAQIALSKKPDPDIHRAVDECNAALRNGRPYSHAYGVLGNCWLKEDGEKAAGYYRQAIQLEPQTVQFRTGLAAALRRSKHWDEARVQAMQAIAQDPDDPAPREELAKIQQHNPQ